MSKPASSDELDRPDVANRLSAYLQRNTELPRESIDLYNTRIQTGEHDDFARNISAALQRLQQDIFADLAGEAEENRGAQGPDVFDLISIEDGKLCAEAAKARRRQPRKPVERDALLAAVEAERKRKRPGSEQKETIVIRDPYPPCVLPLEELKSIKLSEMKEERHHRGRVLFAKRIGGIVTQNTVVAGAVEDEDGEVEAIEFHHVDPTVVDALSESTYFAIKEPYLTLRRHDVVTLRVDHPSDLVVSGLSHEGLPLSAQQIEIKSAVEWKEIGNGHFLKKQFAQARTAYQAGLAVVDDTESKLETDIARNLARVDLDLGRFEEAKAAALRALTENSSSANTALDVKAYYRAGCASYGLKAYAQAVDYFEKVLALDANDVEGKRELQKAQTRLAEQQDGAYDFSTMVKRLSGNDQRVDAADFTSSVVIRDSPYGGRGLFAGKDFAVGDMVLCERPFCSVFEQDKDRFIASEWSEGQLSAPNSATALWQQTVQKLSRNPSTIHEISSLFSGDYKGQGSKDIVVDGTHVIDTFQIHGIISRNGFGIPSAPTKSQRKEPFAFAAESQQQGQLGSNTGLYSHASFVNHSCLPNTRRLFIGDLLLLRATRPISKDEELLISYAQVAADVDVRRRLLETWHFHCKCLLCRTEEQEDATKRLQREELERYGQQLGAGIASGELGPSQVTEAEKLVKKIKSTYDSELYRYVPRKAAAYLQIGLITRYGRQKQRTRCMAMVADFLDMLGWKMIVGRKTEVGRKEGSETELFPQVVDVILQASAWQKMANEPKQAEELKEIARLMYLALNGVENGFAAMAKSRGC